MDDQDRALSLRAIELAHQSIGVSDPNPRVGCVLHAANGTLAGEGFTQEAGGPHAEVAALRAAAIAGADVRGGCAWVSLEPCAHHGRTPPCCDALIAAGLARVVVAMVDPFGQVAGRGIERLRAAGIQVDVWPADDAVALSANELNIGFVSRVLRHRPWVRLKVAASLDGRTALAGGESQWITGAAARADGHHWRKRAGAILTGIGTVRADDPRLDVRDVHTHVQPRRVVVDSRLRLPSDARLIAAPGEVLVAHACGRDDDAAALRRAGATVLHLPDAQGRVDLHALMAALAGMGINELHVEAGPRLNGALIQAGLIDELLVYQAPCILGDGRGMFDMPVLRTLADARRFKLIDMQRIGDDLRLRLRPETACA